MAGLRVRDSILLVVDMQARLLPAIVDTEALVGRCAALAQAASLLGVPVVGTEHCADKIGATAPAMAAWISRVVHKTHFDATREPDFAQALPADRERVLLAGTEAHVCVLQTALGLLASGRRPVMVTDCVGSRRTSDHAAALARAAYYGIETVTSEMAMFEWLESADNPHFSRVRSEEHTSELQSLMRISYAVFCLKKKKKNKNNIQSRQILIRYINEIC